MDRLFCEAICACSAARPVEDPIFSQILCPSLSQTKRHDMHDESDIIPSTMELITSLSRPASLRLPVLYKESQSSPV